MEDEIDSIVNSVFEQDPLVTSVIVVDDSGLCLAKKGPISEEAAGLVTSIAARSDVVMPLSANAVVPKPAVVQIEAENMLIVIRKTASVVVGVFKTKPE
ncbi:hypothetical protein FB645_002446 [Coemansia sp. IMI 203386]|nr:hypothetical protein FB645_002446 [Coemansia sp. IMI 203386]